MKKQDINRQYFYWLANLVCNEQFELRYYQNLLEYFHKVEFTWTIENDENRAIDGINLREQFAYENDLNIYMCNRYLEGPCSILEMLVALSCRCEHDIMDDNYYGNRTQEWFLYMIKSMKLLNMDDGRFDIDYVQFVIDRFLSRTYKRDGDGGLFYIKGTKRDMRKAEIWYQMCWYLDTIIEY